MSDLFAYRLCIYIVYAVKSYSSVAESVYIQAHIYIVHMLNMYLLATPFGVLTYLLCGVFELPFRQWQSMHMLRLLRWLLS